MLKWVPSKGVNRLRLCLCKIFSTLLCITIYLYKIGQMGHTFVMRQADCKLFYPVILKEIYLLYCYEASITKKKSLKYLTNLSISFRLKKKNINKRTENVVSKTKMLFIIRLLGLTCYSLCYGTNRIKIRNFRLNGIVGQCR